MGIGLSAVDAMRRRDWIKIQQASADRIRSKDGLM